MNEVDAGQGPIPETCAVPLPFECFDCCLRGHTFQMQTGNLIMRRGSDEDHVAPLDIKCGVLSPLRLIVQRNYPDAIDFLVIRCLLTRITVSLCTPSVVRCSVRTDLNVSAMVYIVADIERLVER
jgi:hypothetical protein